MERRPPYLRLDGSGEKGIDMGHGAPGEPSTDGGSKAINSLTEGRSASAAELVRRAERYPSLLAALKRARADLADFVDPDGEFKFTLQAGRNMVAQLTTAIEAAEQHPQQ